jgi:phosphatidylserine/phosphatidylglycerophosphate/cardiolipin synthase-like enzyme
MFSESVAAAQVLTSPWASSFYELVESAQEQLLIASPFLSNQPLTKIVRILCAKSPVTDIRVEVLTNLAVDSLLSGVLDMVISLPSTSVTYLPGLHAKVYVADARTAIISSGNLTTSGLTTNYEYGVLLRDPLMVEKVRDDLTKYGSLGNRVPLETLEVLAQATEDLKVVRQRAERSINASLRKEFEERTEQAKLELLRARAQGKTTHGIFTDTVLYLLEQEGALTTSELHPLVKQILPDMCDDSIDRVIGDVHFGKKWKHYVRNSQLALRRRGIIDHDGRRWFRVH